MEIQKRVCVVSIEGSKCKICKKLFKCKTDTKKHIKKKHKYMKRKKDNKRVRVVFKFGEKKFCDNDISRKYLVSPVCKSHKLEEFHKMKKFDQKPLEFSSTKVHKEVPMHIDKDLLAKSSISLIDALNNIKTHDEKTRSINGHINKSQASNSSASAHNIDLKKEERFPMTSSFEAYHGRSSPASIISDTETIIYISDNDMALEELYEDINPNISKVKEDNDSDDGEIVILNVICRNNEKSVPRRIRQTDSANFDIENVRQIGGKVKSEPKIESMGSEPIPQISNPHVPIVEMNTAQALSVHRPTIQVPIAQVSIAQVPIAQVPVAQVLNPPVIDVDYSDVSDAETEVWDSRSVNEDIATFLEGIENYDDQEASQLQAKKDYTQSTVSLLRMLEDDDTQNAFELRTEETYNLTVEEQKPVHAIQEEDSDIIIIEDEEPNKEVRPFVEIEPVVQDEKIVEVESHLQSSKLIELIKNVVLLHEKAGVDPQKMLNDRDDNEYISTARKDLEALRSLFSGSQEDCQRWLQILQIVQGELKAAIRLT